MSRKIIGGLLALVLIIVAAFSGWLYQQGLTMSVGGRVLLNQLTGHIDEPDMVEIQPGTFLMGSPEHENQREVTINQPFRIGRYEVTFAEYDLFAYLTEREMPSDNYQGRGRRPVINVSWYDAVAYTEWLSEQTGKHYRLPTEAEWEYAARAGTTTRWSFGDDENRLSDYAWYYENSDEKTQPVGGKRANPWGLHDMYGNVQEWVQDCSGSNNHRCESDQRILRGGSFSSTPEVMESADRIEFPPDHGVSFYGFRCVLVLH